MAGPFTHMLLCQRAADPTIAKQYGVQYSPDWLKIINNQQCFLLLGSVTPDIPAISDQIRSQSWSDQMHNGQLNRAVVPIFSTLKQSKCRDARLAWLFGYVGHIIGDVVVHPVVSLAKERRGGASSLHRQCEICQDSLLFKDLQSYDLISADYLGWMRETTSDRNAAMFNEAMNIWQDGLNQSGAGPGVNCREWYVTYSAGFEVATNLSRVAINGYVYPKATDITPADRADFYDSVILPVPAGTQASFRAMVFDLALRRLTRIWQQMWTCLNDGQPGGIDALIPDWDLNNGKNRGTNMDNDLWVAP